MKEFLTGLVVAAAALGTVIILGSSGNADISGACVMAGQPDIDFHKLVMKDIDGKDRKLSEFEGKAVLVVNTASNCGFTSQYEGLQKLADTYGKRGFTVLGFPSNDFGGQEPGTEQEIKRFCEERFQVTFPMFAKVKVTGEKKDPLYMFLTEQTSEDVRGPVRWNFTKFLVNPKGEVVDRFGSMTKPMDSDVTKAIEAALP